MAAITITALALQAKKVRRLQQEYFRTRSSYVLANCKHEENVLSTMADQALAENPPLPATVQGNLFT